jgi:hypothetical protein
VKHYIIDGSAIDCLADFYREIGEAVNGPGGCFGDSLDDLADCLLGGMGTPDDEGFYFTWTSSSRARQALGHDETARVLQRTLPRVHPTNRTAVRGRIEDAEQHRGATLFDVIVDIFRERDVRLDLE